VQAAAEEIVQGILGILDEVGTTKIGEAFEAQNPFLLESRFSNSSLQDFQANLRSAQIAYIGQMPNVRSSGNTSKGLSSFIASVDPRLDAQVRQEMQAAQSALAAVPGPIEDHLCSAQAKPKIQAAIDSIMTLRTTVEQRVLPLVQ
jgi:putative iron-regulated protein